MARHKAFDRGQVLDRAIEVFWSQGYEGTSIQDLVERMGIHRGSLYHTFGDKHGLFLEALERYEERFHRGLLGTLEDVRSPRKAIVRVFDKAIEECACASGRRGCLLTNSAVELSGLDEDTRARVKANFEWTEAAFEKTLHAARESGEIAKRHEPKALARFLTCSLQGLRVVAKVGAGRSVLQDIARVTLSTLD